MGLFGPVTGMGPGTKAASGAVPPPCLRHVRPADRKRTTPRAGEAGTPPRRRSHTGGGSRHTPQSLGGPRDGRYDDRRQTDYRPPARGEPSRPSPQWLHREDVRGPEHRPYKAHGGYGERIAYPRPESYPMTQAHRAPVASPPPAAYWGPPPLDPRYSGDGRTSLYGATMPPQGTNIQQAPYQHQPYMPVPPIADATATPSGYSGPWYGEAVPVTVAAPPVAPVAPVAPPFGGPALERRPDVSELPVPVTLG